MNEELNNWFYSLTLSELQQYVIRLETENEKLVRELTETNKLNFILESIAKSTQTGYTLLRRIMINKSCNCNEHLNVDFRQLLGESIKETNQFLSRLQMFQQNLEPAVNIDDRTSESIPSSSVSPLHSEHPLVIDLSNDTTNNNSQTSKGSPFSVNYRRQSTDDKESSSLMSESPHSSGYESNDYNAEHQTVAITRVPNLVFHNDYNSTHKSESHFRPKATITASSVANVATGRRPSINNDLPQNLTLPKSSLRAQQVSPAAAAGTQLPLPIMATNTMTSARESATNTQNNNNSNVLFTASNGSTIGPINGSSQHLPNRCSNCDLSFNLKSSLDQHLLTHLTPTFTIQRAGRGRPAKNDSRILRVTDSDLNILRMNTGAGGRISLQALETLRRQKFTGYGRYRCPWPDCGYTPHFLRDLRRHMFKHTGDKKYKCDYDGCDFITVWKTSLLQHQRKKHNISPDPSNILPKSPTPNHTDNSMLM
ncbi:uncharacterized protein LOC128954125 [Oppia nitens]|uniref:uncharacterized protein LOC128954125 n=1 Tax=Oppia nitens TaxID=1686743 RepID=UPI0023DB991A|nr:uncharacterized protein LOC128954125 [Oppia nitens]